MTTTNSLNKMSHLYHMASHLGFKADATKTDILLQQEPPQLFAVCDTGNTYILTYNKMSRFCILRLN